MESEVRETLHNSDISLADRCRQVIERLVQLDCLQVQHKGGIYLADGDTLGLLTTVGEFSEGFLEREATISVGSSLCGRAAMGREEGGGEVLVCDDCFSDPRHEHEHDGTEAYGQYIVPMMASGEGCGVLFLYTAPHPPKDRDVLKTLRSLGEVLGGIIAGERLAADVEVAREAQRRSVHSMAVELRSPLVSLLGSVRVLENKRTDVLERGRVLEQVRLDAEHLVAVVDNVIDISVASQDGNTGCMDEVVGQICGQRERVLVDRRILVVTDSLNTSRELLFALDAAGARVELAQDERRGMGLASAAQKAGRPHSVIVFDAGLEAGKVKYAVRMLRKSGVGEPVIVRTSEDDEVIQELLAVGCDDVLGMDQGMNVVAGVLARLSAGQAQDAA